MNGLREQGPMSEKADILTKLYQTKTRNTHKVHSLQVFQTVNKIPQDHLNYSLKN